VTDSTELQKIRDIAVKSLGEEEAKSLMHT
jgi:hypothetical protein